MRLPRLTWAMVLVVTTLAHAGSPPAGTANLSIRAEGGTVLVEFSAPALTMVGFTDAPENPTQREDLKLAAENLKKGDALVRFNPEALCSLEWTKVDADPRLRKGAALLGASYRFGCALPGSLRSAALGLFIGFPALERVHVQYATAEGRGAAVLTPGNPVVRFVPLQ